MSEDAIYGSIDEFVHECTQIAQRLAKSASISPVSASFIWNGTFKRVIYQPPQSAIDILRIENEKLKIEIDELRETNKRQRGRD